ncbi:MAG TPA: adenylate/guanylate cyclase domain-containing protein [Myxococcota bacterium]|nr:adenylate/guanylate cyclase domain-containing protein [Myxococcota bacterium]
MRCGAELLAGRKFCVSCGAPAQVPCSHCGAGLEPGWRFCPDCGREVPSAAPAAPVPIAPASAAPALPVPAEPAAPAADVRLSRLSRHIPETLAERIRAAGAVAGERKRATVFFCDLVGSTALAERLDPEEYRDLLEQYLELVLGEIYRFEGIVNQLAGDGLMALFGAPIAHEDAPERAVLAALAIQRELRALSERLTASGGAALHARIGIHTGVVVAGTVGNELKMDYTATGDTTNLAARLQSLAKPGTILVSDATFSLLRGRFQARRLGPFEVKGKSEPVIAHEVEAPVERVHSFVSHERGELTPLVGRNGELGQIMGCFDSLGGGLAQIVSLVGDAGMGKSRLVHEFRKKLKGRDVELLEARCSSLTRAIPYSPWHAMFNRWFGLEPTDDDREKERKIAARFTDLEGTLDPDYVHLCWMLGVTPAAGEKPSDDSVKQGSFEAVERLIERMSERVPVVILLEDLHWIDDASREILEQSLAGASGLRVMFLLTHRSDFEQRWQSNAAMTVLRLRPLHDEEAARIVVARAGGAVPPEVEKRILRKADGNPFYLEELTRALVEDGTLAVGDAGVRATRSAEEIRIPDTIGELLGARIDRLSPAAKRVAQVASVLGRQFARSHVEKLLEGEPIDVLAELHELERRGILHRNGSIELGELRFGESLTQEVAYEGLLLRERRQLHDRCAQIFEAEARGEKRSGDARRALALAAHHLARGDDRARGIAALLDAAQQALTVPSYGDAIRLFREAWQLAELTLGERREPSPEAKRLALRAAVGISGAAVVYGDAGSERDEQATRAGIALAEELGDDESLAPLLVNYGIIVLNGTSDRFAEGVQLAERGVAVAHRAGLLAQMPKISRGLVWAYLLDARFDEARRQVDAVIDSLVAAGHADRNSDIYLGTRYFRNRMLLESDHLDETEADAVDLYARATAAGNRTMQSASASILASVATARGDAAKAEYWAEVALPIAEQIQNLAAVRGATAALMLARADRGERNATQADLDRLEKGLFASGDLGVNSDSIVEALLEVGELRRARRIAEGRVERSGGRLRQARGAVMTGMVALASGPEFRAEAERAFSDALARGAEIGCHSAEGRAHLGLAELAHERGDAAAMESHARQALAILRPLGFGRYAMKAARLLLERLEGAPPNA